MTLKFEAKVLEFIELNSKRKLVSWCQVSSHDYKLLYVRRGYIIEHANIGQFHGDVLSDGQLIPQTF